MKKNSIATLFLIIGVICYGAYNTIGTKVLADGTLQEPFFLLPLGGTFIAIGIILYIVGLVLSLVNKNKNK